MTFVFFKDRTGAEIAVNREKVVVVREPVHAENAAGCAMIDTGDDAIQEVVGTVREVVKALESA